MTYSVKEIFLTLQGEGTNAGRVAVFCRFIGCNLWTGREEDRHRAVCTFCDTDFLKKEGDESRSFSNPDDLADAIVNLWPVPFRDRTYPFDTGLVVFTGGEPMLQLDLRLCDALHDRSFEIAVETNGTQSVPFGMVDHICVSPKSNAPLLQGYGHELKLVYPQPLAPPERFANLTFKRFYLQPMDGPNLKENIDLAIRYCLEHPQWRLSLQTHKLIGVR